jgi:flagellar biosynthetic protein FliR
VSWLTEYNLQQFLVFALVLARVSALAMTAPIYGAQEVPMQIRALIAFALAVLIVPTQLGAHFPNPQTLVDLVLILGGELLIGLTLGLGVMILFSGIQLTGQIIGQVSGMTLADVFNPAFDTSIPLLSQMLYMFTLAIYVTVGGHRLLMAGLLDTFATIPPGLGGLSTSLGDASITLLTQSVDLGVRAAAPAVVALLVATLVLGLISRTLPQLNILAVGFGINATFTLITVSVSLGAIAWLFQAELEPALEILVDALHDSG